MSCILELFSMVRWHEDKSLCIRFDPAHLLWTWPELPHCCIVLTVKHWGENAAVQGCVNAKSFCGDSTLNSYGYTENMGNNVRSSTEQQYFSITIPKHCQKTHYRRGKKTSKNHDLAMCVAWNRRTFGCFKEVEHHNPSSYKLLKKSHLFFQKMYATLQSFMLRRIHSSLVQRVLSETFCLTSSMC